MINYFNSLSSGRSECDFKSVVFNLASLIGIFRSSYDNAFRWLPLDLTDDMSSLVQVMAWCRQATSRYLSQNWPSSMIPYGVIRPRWVNYLKINSSIFRPTDGNTDNFTLIHHKKLLTRNILWLVMLCSRLIYIGQNWPHKRQHSWRSTMGNTNWGVPNFQPTLSVRD